MATKRLTKEQILKRNRRIRRKFKGAVLVSLALIGVAAIVWLVVSGISMLRDDSDDKEYYEKLYWTLAALDPMPFNLNNGGAEDVLMESALWAVINNEDTSKYQRDAQGNLLLPAVDVGVYARRMFSEQFKIEHTTFSGSGLDYEYNPETNMYTIPAAGFSGAFYPVVTEIINEGNTRTLKVAYYLASTLTGFGETETPYKFMDFILQKEEGEFRLVEVRDPQLDAATE